MTKLSKIAFALMCVASLSTFACSDDDSDDDDGTGGLRYPKISRGVAPPNFRKRFISLYLSRLDVCALWPTWSRQAEMTSSSQVSSAVSMQSLGAMTRVP